MKIRTIGAYRHELPAESGPRTMADAEVRAPDIAPVELVIDTGAVGRGVDVVAAACVHAGAGVRPHLLERVWLAAPYIERHYDESNPVRVEEHRPGTSRRAPGRASRPVSSPWR